MSYLNWKTRPVQIGHLFLGGDAPIRIQSMTTSPTADVPATVTQIMRLADTGCEIVRVTVQGLKEAKACAEIKNILIQKNYIIPLVADIHFFPQAALFVADFVDKVRINPGNFADKRATFTTLPYNDVSYAKELERIKELFLPLVEKCKKLKKALRIGVNHGSLSDRIMTRYGDTPKGMIESAVEFAHICRAADYHDIVFSMKSSNPKVMITAYRQLVEKMVSLGWDYPLHIGVTEAGSGIEGRVKSAMGIGALLLDGIGDTIRISLTEDPWNEIAPAQRLIKLIEQATEPPSPPLEENTIHYPPSFHPTGTVVTQEPHKDCTTPEGALHISSGGPQEWSALLKTLFPPFIVLSPTKHRIDFCRKFFAWLHRHPVSTPIILHFPYNTHDEEDLALIAAAEYGSLFCDGLGHGLWIDSPCNQDYMLSLSFHILQAARMRMTKTDYISCPGCGRTLFNLQEVSQRIQAKTSHLPNVKIAIMGCIVNGPGEMADADFGYVGSKPGMIDLYAGKKCIEKNIPSAEAEERLIALIKAHGKWIDRPT